MDRYFNLKLPVLSRKSGCILLASFWILGLVTGAGFSAAAGNSLVSLMRTAVFVRVSISGLLMAILLPFLLSAFAVYIQEPWLLLPISFGKAFLVSFLGCSLMTAYGSAGWLVRILLMFSECCSLPLLFWYWLRNISGRSRTMVSGGLPVLLAAALIGSFDYCFVSPFLANVIS